MQTLIHADIFFFISTIALVIISIGIVIALIFIILILKNLHRLSETVRTEAGHIAEDIDAMRAKAKGFSWGIAFKIFKSLFTNRNK
ncbi:MAG: hypothetical protein PHG25_01970 [Candidatus Pacebacteria bacterium]|nr:hypothetical protein [Candidatus Paceibacterota bacterium]